MADLTTFPGDLLNAEQISKALGIEVRSVRRRAKNEAWGFDVGNVRGGKQKRFPFKGLPADVQAAVLKKYGIKAKAAKADLEAAADDLGETPFTYDKDALWDAFNRKTQKQKDKAIQQAGLLHQVVAFWRANLTPDTGEKAAESQLWQAMQIIGQAHDVSPFTLRNWWNGAGHKRGAKHYAPEDWAPALAGDYTGRTKKAELSTAAWDFYTGLYLNRRHSSHAECYRRTQEVAQLRGWTLPCARTLEREIERVYSRATVVFFREGEHALKYLYPWQHRDKTCFKAGEAVSGDGLKFDKVWVAFEDGEILNTTTGWFWQDIYSGKILAHRLGKTENTDLFRLATYDLTEVAVPYYVNLDNTRVAANKAMTGQAPTRHRFGNQPNDPMGILIQMGMDVHFTNPDQRRNGPGSKPMERAFGIGGIHDKVSTHPALLDRGYSKATAIPFMEFRKIVADEVKRHNAQPKRQSPVCGGVLSFDEAFAKSYVNAAPRKASEVQRRLLLLLPEVVKTHKQSGTITLQAGKGPLGKHRYWHEALVEVAGDEVVVYYDPQCLPQPVQVYTLAGKPLCEATWLPSTAFNDTEAAREWAKNKNRALKAMKAAAAAQQRMTTLELQQQLPERQDAALPEAKVITGLFGVKQGRTVVEDGVVIDVETGEILNVEDRFVEAIKRLDGQF